MSDLMKKTTIHCLRGLLVFLTVMAGAFPSTAFGESAETITATIYTNLNQSRSDIWQKAAQRGIDPAQLRLHVGPARAAEFDLRPWPLQKNSILDGLAMTLNQQNLNSQNLKAGLFSGLLAASREPHPLAEQAGYQAAEIDILYAVSANSTLTDPLQTALQLWDLIVDEELARLNRGENSLLFATPTADVGLALSGQQLIVDGSSFYTYILTVIVARPQMPWPLAADTFIRDGLYNGQPGLPVFDARYYLQANPDLLTALGRDYDAALSHWQRFGMYEGRAGSAAFNAYYYLEANPDLKAAFGNNYPAAISHWLLYGIHEGRASAPGFDARRYLDDNSDLQSIYGQDYQAATWHYLTWGLVEGR
jgi:hypothetical protein